MHEFVGVFSTGEHLVSVRLSAGFSGKQKQLLPKTEWACCPEEVQAQGAEGLGGGVEPGARATCDQLSRAELRERWQPELGSQGPGHGSP